jgi:D-glycero-D-manno-heptose 1,7-bisphosphate phosphatase
MSLAMQKLARRCVFFDRDGIINVAPQTRYVTHPEAFHLQPEFVQALRVTREKGYEAVVITNQAGVERGDLPPATLDEIHDKMVGLLQQEGLGFLDIYVCPHLDDAHPHRKPNPGMILDAARKHGIDLAHSWMVGDSERDVRAGRRAGCRTVLVKPGAPETEADFRLDDIAALPGFLRERL